jgi:hypothetical protein
VVSHNIIQIFTKLSLEPFLPNVFKMAITHKKKTAPHERPDLPSGAKEVTAAQEESGNLRKEYLKDIQQPTFNGSS